MTKVAAKELTEGDVQFISLVNRGANREPFRILKGVDTMIDLARVFKRESSAKTGVAFVAVSKAIELDAAKALVEKGGFATDNVVEQDAGTLFVQDGFAATDKVVLYRVTDDVMFGVAVPDAEKVVKGYESYNWQSTDFSEVLATEQTIPLFHLAMTALCDTFYNTLQKAESPDEARSSVQKMLNDFTAHVLDVLGNVPVTAFKLETVLSDALTVMKTDNQVTGEGAETKTDTETSEDADASEDETSEDDADAAAVQKAEGEEAEDDDNAEADDDAEDDAEGDDPEAIEKGMGKGKGKDKLACKGGDKAKGKAKPGMEQDAAADADPKAKKMPAKKGDDEEASSEDAPPAWASQLLKSVEDVNAQVASVASEVNSVKKNVDALGEDLTATKANFAKMDEALGTGVIGGDAEDGEEEGTKASTRKSDGSFANSDDEGFVSFDTAFGDPFADEK